MGSEALVSVAPRIHFVNTVTFLRCKLIGESFSSNRPVKSVSIPICTSFRLFAHAEPVFSCTRKKPPSEGTLV